ncbi:hypothetical protein GCK72_019769 [Caenorhabditis remanei]|uniref:Tr-type G domain-containing protein n=1 Tax=Caenorhabditis remanei TaxID=31234 RepID=A0A6A5GEX2_CAERE|nr:hypothetical protein GCK72_019769 [Caenorhabditis remanei]KAF1753213.1 hypothetical protein GCK72_019769 [Caenorhabditis remanei]
MGRTRNIRNISVIGNNEHGKTSVTNCLTSSAGIMIMEKDTTEMYITVTSAAISLELKMKNDDLDFVKGEDQMETVEIDGKTEKVNSFLINLIESPRLTNFSPEMSSQLRIVDGAIVVVDCVSGVEIQTESVLRQAIPERVKQILFINKMDRTLLELKLGPEEIYQTFKDIVDNINTVISTFGNEDAPFEPMNPSIGNVGFGSAVQRWGFTLKQFAEMYAEKFGISVDKIMKNLWGNRFFDSTTKKWSSTKTNENQKRGFNQFVLEPIFMVMDATLNLEKEKIETISEKLGVELTDYEKDLEGQAVMKAFMRKWLPGGDSILQMAAIHLPSPVTAQKYRMEILYEGSLDDETALAIRACDSNGPLMMYVSKMLPTSNKERFYAFGRVFSGKVVTGQKARIQGPSYVSGQKKDLYEAPIKQIVFLMGRFIEFIDEIPVGNVCCLVGIDQYLVKGGTLTTLKDAHNIRSMKYSVSPVMRVSVEPKNPDDLPKLLDGLKRLTEVDPTVQFISEEEGELFIAGSSDHHLETCIKILEDDGYIPLNTSEPFVLYRETVLSKSNQLCMAKSPNKMNRFFCTAEPVPVDLIKDLESDHVNGIEGYVSKDNGVTLAKKHGIADADNIWCFGTQVAGPNILCDNTKHSEFNHEIKKSVIAGFRWTTAEGVLCQENMRGVQFNIVDMNLHQRSNERGSGQIICGFRRNFYSCALTAEPRLLEPVYLVEIQCLEDAIEETSELLSGRRGQVFEKFKTFGASIFTLKGYLPVNESIGFITDSRSIPGVLSIPQYVFDHWQLLPGDPLEDGTMANKIMLDIRKRKGLKESIPDLNDYLDKM